jgi:gliding motility-associated-like protein
VDLSASIQPQGATLLLNPAFLTGTAMGSLIVRTDRNTTPGYYTIIVTGTGGGSTRADTVSLCVKPLDFEIVVTPESHEIVAGETASYQIRLRVIGDFNASVRLSVSGHPAGREPSFERNPISPADSTTLTIYTEPTTPVQLYFLIITGEGGGSVHRDTVTLRVKEPPDFALQVDPATQTVKVGETALYRISIVPIAGFKDSVALAIADLSVPTRTTVELKPDVITPGQDSKLTIPTSSQAQLGTYAFKVIGKSQLLTHDTTATIIIIIEQIAGVLPNPFTPNSDGFNDFVTFNVQGLLESGGEVIIYNFRGRKVRELSGENRWDGKSDNGEDLPFGMYLYIVKVDGKVKASGSLTLIR